VHNLSLVALCQKTMFVLGRTAIIFGLISIKSKRCGALLLRRIQYGEKELRRGNLTPILDVCTVYNLIEIFTLVF
jgi:hypothetical protein